MMRPDAKVQKVYLYPKPVLRPRFKPALMTAFGRLLPHVTGSKRPKADYSAAA